MQRDDHVKTSQKAVIYMSRREASDSTLMTL